MERTLHHPHRPRPAAARARQGLAWLTAFLLVAPFFRLSAQEQLPAPTPARGSAEGSAEPITAPDDLPGVLPPPGTPPGNSDNPAPSDSRPSPLFPRKATDDSGTADNPVQRQADNWTIITNPAVQIVSTISQQGLSNGESMFSGPGGVPNPLSARFLSTNFDRRNGFLVGPAWVIPSLDVGGVYRSQRGRIADGSYDESYLTITPTVTVLLGSRDLSRYLSLQYQGVASLGDTEGRGAYDQRLDVDSFYIFSKLALGVGVQFSELSGADQDFSGDNVDRYLLAVSGRVDYQYAEKSGLDLTVSVPLRLYQQGDSSEGVNSQLFFNYFYSPLTSIGVGGGLGTLAVGGDTQVFEQALLRFRYAPDPKLSFDLTVGYEFRQTDGSEENTPIFRAGITWHPQDSTTLVLSGERSVYNSAALNDTNYTTTSVSLSVSQQVTPFLEGTLTLGYNDNSYEAAGSGQAYGRDEQYFFVQAGLNARLGQHWRLTLSASYSYLESSDHLPNVPGTQDASSLYGIASGNLRVIQLSLQIGYEF